MVNEYQTTLTDGAFAVSNNTIPAIPSACAIFTKHGEFPAPHIVVEFSAPAPATPTVMSLELSTLGSPLLVESVQVPPHATVEQLVDIAMALPRPAHVQAFKGAQQNAGSVLFMANGTAFVGFRLHIQVPDEYQQVDPANVSRRAAYWGDAHPSQFV